ncbi:MAG: IclR family transcriptional regulator domain-containing protein [Beijerinckiaceae bacterium]
MPRDETVESFRRGLDVIRSFDGQRSQTITDVAAQTGLTRAAARRFLLTLTSMGLARSDGKNFELTPAILTIGQTFLSGLSQLEIVREVLVDLTRETEESASAAMLDGSDIIYVARSPAMHRIMSVTLAVGTRLPAHATSMGQVLLAQLHPRELDQYLAQTALKPYTGETITAAPAMRARLADIRANGFALVSDELEIGLRSIAVPVSEGPRGPHLAINISAQAARVSAQTMREKFLPALRRAVEAISMAASR